MPGQLKDRLRRLEQFGDMSVHPSEAPRLAAITNIIFDVEHMAEIDARSVHTLYSLLDFGMYSKLKMLSPSSTASSPSSPTTYSAIQILIEIVDAYHARHVQVYFVKLAENARELFKLSGLTEKVGNDHIYKRVSGAIDHIERNTQGYDTV